MVKVLLNVRLRVAAVLLLVSSAAVSGGTVVVLQYPPIQNDSLKAKTIKSKVNSPLTMPPTYTDTTTGVQDMADTGGMMKYIYGAPFNDATLYPSGSIVKWKVNRFITNSDGTYTYVAELGRGEATAN